MRAPLLIAGLALLLHAQAQVHVSGRVLDASTSEPLPYCAVGLVRQGSGTLTNTDGAFLLEATDADDSLRVAALGYATVRLRVGDVAAGSATIRLQPKGIELRPLEVTRNDRLYRLLATSGKRMRQHDPYHGKAYLELESRTEGQPVEVVEAFYNARFDGPHLEGLDLKNGRIGIAPVNGNYFVSRNTTKAMTLMDLARPGAHFPATPFQGGAKAVRERFDLTLEGVVPGTAPAYRIRFTPRTQDGTAFEGTVWLDTATLVPQRVELHCPDCTQQPFIPLWKGPVVDSVQLHLTLDLATVHGRPVLDVMTLAYTLRYTSERRTDVIGTTAVLHHFAPGASFMLPLFDYDDTHDDYRKISFLPYDSVFWRTAPTLLRTPQQERDLAFFATKGQLLGHGRELPFNARYFESNYAYWSAEKRIGLKYSFAQRPYEGAPAQLKYGAMPEASKVDLQAQLFLSMDTVGDSLRIFTATVFDGFKSYWLANEEVSTNCTINLFFDLCEIERRKLDVALRGVRDPTVVRRRHEEASKNMARTGQRFLHETSLGSDARALARWNAVVRDQLHIDNMKLFGLEGER